MTPHQVALTLAGQQVVAGATVLHDCDVRLCCRVDLGHVRASTQRENMRQAVARGHARGPRPGWVDVRGPAGLSRAIQRGMRASPDRSRSGLAVVLADVLAAGHPLRDHPVLFDVG